MNTTIRRGVGLALLASFAAGAVLLAQPANNAARPHGGQHDHVMLVPKDLKWADGPESLPPGAQIATLEGDPMMSGPFTFRVKLPKGYEIPAHTHPGIEHVTVISGKLHMGTGDKLDRAKATALPAGSFAVMQVGTHHFAFADEETIVQIHGIGPWGITYIDPAMDPRRKK